jgi:class 3 adenylate cyclase
LVVVGDLIGAGASQEQAIVGETPNLAARLQGIADPNAVVIAESTRKLVGNFVRAWTGPQGYLGHGASRGRTATSYRREPFRRSARDWPDRACRTRGTRTAATAL